MADSVSLRLRDLSLSKKLTLSVVIFLFPVCLLAYFLVIEKDDLINFTKQEIAGVTYLRAATAAAGVLTAPEVAKDTLGEVVSNLRKAEQADAGVLTLTEKNQNLVAAVDGVAGGKDTSDSLARVGDLISAASDNSNITLDPDTDAYFVGDILVNQATGVLMQTSALVSAAHTLDGEREKTDDHKIAYAEARDGVATSAGNLAADLGKAIKGNTDGSVAKNLEAGGKEVAAVVDELATATKSDDRKALMAAADHVNKVIRSFTIKSADEMEHLLNNRVDGFHSVLFTRLTTALLSVLLGGLISWIVVRSITKPLNLIASLMGRLTAGELTVELPQQERKDEVGNLIVALKAFHGAAVDRDKARTAERMRAEAEQKRAILIKDLNATFKDSVLAALGQLNGAVGQLNQTAGNMARDSDSSSGQLTAVAAAAEEASANVQTVAAASEELSASIKEISRQIGTSTSIAQQAVQEAKQTRAMVEALSDATTKIGDVVSLINQIAGQTNLLALNATIEAARAGEAGKGFAVVASEVKTLANQTARATEDITGHINGIQESVRNVTRAIQNIDKTISQINDISATIASAINEQGAATQEISGNVQEAATGTAEVTVNITKIAQTIAGAGQTAQELSIAAKQLDSQAGKLGEDVDAYLAKIQSA